MLYFGLGKPSQALPAQLPFATEADASYMIEYDVAKANALLDEMGMKRGADGMRTFPDGSPFTILWEYSSQFAIARVRQADDRLSQGGRAEREPEGADQRGDARERQGRAAPTSTWSGTFPTSRR